jgi:hypothetical protein
MADKSPFYIIEEFTSPLLCEQIIDIVNYTIPDTDQGGNPVKTTKTCDGAEEILFERVSSITNKLMAYYHQEYRGMERMHFEWFPEGSVNFYDRNG